MRAVLSLTSISSTYAGLFNKKYYLHIYLVLWVWCF